MAFLLSMVAFVSAQKTIGDMILESVNKVEKPTVIICKAAVCGGVHVEPSISTVKGTVTDEKDKPLVGACVVVEGTSHGTLSDNDGKYSIEIFNNSPKLVFSFSGYDSQTRGFKGELALDVKLKESKPLPSVGTWIGAGCIRQFVPYSEPSRAISGTVTDEKGEPLICAFNINVRTNQWFTFFVGDSA